MVTVKASCINPQTYKQRYTEQHFVPSLHAYNLQHYYFTCCFGPEIVCWGKQ